MGWREWVSLPDLGIERIKAKADTGARTSALHAYEIELLELGGQTVVRFKVHPEQRDASSFVVAEAPLVEERWVRSSSGHSTRRPVVQTVLALGDRCWPIDLTLVRRDMMGFRLLLGRQALRRRAVVHPGRSFLLSSVASR